jgi:hypothetical protein
VEDIIKKVSGVFLWVTLVVAPLLAGMSYSDRIRDLQIRLDALPSELEKLYDGMLSSLDPFYLKHAAQFFKFAQVSFEPPSLSAIAFADEDDCFLSALKREIEPLSSDQIEYLHETMRRRINSRCKGLLEANSAAGASFPTGFRNGRHFRVWTRFNIYTERSKTILRVPKFNRNWTLP